MFMVLACLILQLDNVLLSNQIITRISTCLWIYRFWDLLKLKKKYFFKACLKKFKLFKNLPNHSEWGWTEFGEFGKFSESGEYKNLQKHNFTLITI